MTTITKSTKSAKSTSNAVKEEKNMKKNNTTTVNATTNNYNTNIKEETTMNENISNITRTNNHKSTVEIISEVNDMGVKLEYLAIDGVKIGTMGYTSPRDKELAIKFVQKIVDNSDKTGYALYNEIMQTCMTGAAMTEEGIDAKESAEDVVDGVPVIINYRNCKIYMGLNDSLKELANLDDLNCALPKEAVQTLLKERAAHAIADMRKRDDDDYWEDDEEDEYWD